MDICGRSDAKLQMCFRTRSHLYLHNLAAALSIIPSDVLTLFDFPIGRPDLSEQTCDA